MTDPNILRLIGRFLRQGIMGEEKILSESGKKGSYGVPQAYPLC